MNDRTPRTIAAGQYLRLVRRDHWEYCSRINCSSVVAVVPITDDAKLLLVEQFRVPLGTSVIEIPAGLVGDGADQSGESEEIAARRELLEETGHEARQWTLLARGPTTPGLSDETMALYLARGLRRLGPVLGDGHEQITLHEVRLTDLRAWLQNAAAAGRMIDIKVYSGLFLAARHCPDLLGVFHGSEATGQHE